MTKSDLTDAMLWLGIIPATIFLITIIGSIL